MGRLTRRRALQTGFLGAAAASCTRTAERTAFTAVDSGADGVFRYGVASGDPRADSVVIWTALALPAGARTADPMTVVWETAADREFTDMRGKGESQTGAARGWTVKAVVGDLNPGETVYYRFRAGDAVSPVGRARTLPSGAVERARFAVISCSNIPFGFFNVYDQIARREDFDAVLHLGDYFYEYGRDGYGAEEGAALGRQHEPPHECVTLDDYRMRHAQYKSDPCLQAAHAMHPFITIWDDHETSNNSWSGGAENHDPSTEGSWDDRRRAALQAYYEWMPIRDPEPGMAREAIFRAFSFGDLLTVAALETRLMARSRPFDYAEVVAGFASPADVEKFRTETMWEESREMLGAAQLDYLAEAMRASRTAGQPWRLIANQVIMANVIAPDLNPHVTEDDIAELESIWPPARAFVEASALGLPVNFDAWDGYPAARERLYAALADAGAEGLIVITGDTHTWWANDLARRDGAHVGVELGVHSVTSPSPYRKAFLGGKGAEYALLTAQENRAVRYISGEDHGYIDLEITRESAEARFMAVDNIESSEYSAFEKAAFTVKKSGGAAQFASVRGLNMKERALF